MYSYIVDLGLLNQSTVYHESKVNNIAILSTNTIIYLTQKYNIHRATGEESIALWGKLIKIIILIEDKIAIVVVLYESDVSNWVLSSEKHFFDFFFSNPWSIFNPI